MKPYYIWTYDGMNFTKGSYDGYESASKHCPQISVPMRVVGDKIIGWTKYSGNPTTLKSASLTGRDARMSRSPYSLFGR